MLAGPLFVVSTITKPRSTIEGHGIGQQKLKRVKSGVKKNFSFARSQNLLATHNSQRLVKLESNYPMLGPLYFRPGNVKIGMLTIALWNWRNVLNFDLFYGNH